MTTVTKARIVENIARAGGLERDKAAMAVEITLGIIKENLAQGDNLMISGFGKFEVRGKSPRLGRNPATGEKMTLSARRVLVFRFSPKLKGRLNGRGNKLDAKGRHKVLGRMKTIETPCPPRLCKSS